VKKRLSPQEKKQLAYDRDHYVSGGESCHGFRKKWPKKKATMNQKFRHQVAQALHKMEKIGDAEIIENSTVEVTAEQIRKPHPKDKLSKWGVTSLKEFVKSRLEKRVSRTRHRHGERERDDAFLKGLIIEFERNQESRKAKHLILLITHASSGLHDFLKTHPAWKARLQNQLLEKEKTERQLQIREAEKKRIRTLQRAIQKQVKANRH
jgi:hypothetical protein